MIKLINCLSRFLCRYNDARAGSGEGSWEVWKVWRVDMKEGGGGEVGRGQWGKGRLGGGNGEWEEGNVMVSIASWISGLGFDFT